VVTTVTPIERNRVNVTFTVTEGDAARIDQGHPHRGQPGLFSESTLLGTDGPHHWRLADLVHQVRPLLAQPSSTPTWRR
jgi:hypothetical protein